MFMASTGRAHAPYRDGLTSLVLPRSVEATEAYGYFSSFSAEHAPVKVLSMQRLGQ